MRTVRNVILFAGLVILNGGCRDLFVPDFESGSNDYLVVEGYIHLGEKAVTLITLSRVSPLGADRQEYETNAFVTIENQNHESFPLTEKETGRYFSDSLSLTPELQYRLLFTTKDGREYASDYVQGKVTPQIDSLHWRRQEDGIQLYITTHDAANKTGYYKWTYDETWEIRSDHQSLYTYLGNGGMSENSDAQTNALYFCWVNSSSTAFNFYSTRQFETDFIHHPLINFGVWSEKLLYKYSILVHQRAMTEEEFNYLSLVRKNTSVTGSIFDPMPSELHGNISSLSSPGEQVIGYIGAYTTRHLRYFISGADVGLTMYPKCQERFVKPDSLEYYFGLNNYIPIDLAGLTPLGEQVYSGADQSCMDCRLRGSSNPPDFWGE